MKNCIDMKNYDLVVYVKKHGGSQFGTQVRYEANIVFVGCFSLHADFGVIVENVEIDKPIQKIENKNWYYANITERGSLRIDKICLKEKFSFDLVNKKW
jgi:hypothetical protein